MSEYPIVYKSKRRGFVVRESQGRYILFHNEEETFAAAELINGQEGLERQFKGDFEVWYNKKRQMKLKTYHSYKQQIKDMEKTAESIAKNWNLEVDA